MVKEKGLQQIVVSFSIEYGNKFIPFKMEGERKR